MTEPLRNTASLIQPLVERAGSTPGKPAVILIEEDGQSRTINAADFHMEAASFSAGLQQVGIGENDLVVLVMQHSSTLLTVFWGALYAGAIPSIFPYLTEKLDPEIYAERVKMLVAHSGVAAVITTGGLKGQLEQLFDDLPCQVIDAADLRMPELVISPPETNIAPEKIAFLQHSSGTTGLQKGVALTHAAVQNQIRAYARAIEVQTESDVVVSWLPLYHDMGLIAGFVMPLVLGLPLVLMSPFHWVKDPGKLFQLIDEHKATLCWLPNFAYNHMVRAVRLRGLEGVDLQSLRMTINCSEPVRLDSHRMFFERFSRFGLRPEALATCYAMAENTFAVTQSRPGKEVPVDWVDLQALQTRQIAVPVDPDTGSTAPIVSCGKAIAGVSIAVISDTGARLPDRTVGEIMLRSDSMLREYYRRPDLTADALRDGWYRTGDMGYLADGHLYITGRKKDLIIVGGKNIYPQDLEAIAAGVEGVYPGRAVAFGVLNERMGTDDIVMVCELNGSSEADVKQRIESELRRKIVQQTEVTLRDVRLVPQRWLLKTSSGKIARSLNRDKYLEEWGTQ